VPITIVHDFLQVTENGYVLNLYLSPQSDVEFADEIGRLENPIDDRYLFSYVHRKFPKTPINKVRLIDGKADIVTVPFMTLMADVKPPV
jgi:hypothetical protein